MFVSEDLSLMYNWHGFTVLSRLLLILLKVSLSMCALGISSVCLSVCLSKDDGKNALTNCHGFLHCCSLFIDRAIYLNGFFYFNVYPLNK